MEGRLEVLLKDAEEQRISLQKVPVWFRNWKSPWKGKVTGGELIRIGEEELYDLGIRIREKFSDLFNDDYHPDVYTIKATQVSCACFFYYINSICWILFCKFAIIKSCLRS